eukprot:TRINITY_DN11315_c0_g1_i5.p1 TRINITY_DN11315_c0_g1~~TRINITY_DN11315_c0_g1_i5.p1  ORF type:complete len:169 (+),score=19.99 TRINITY_DN11315_c0_g1_i5:616-1122(+)
MLSKEFNAPPRFPPSLGIKPKSTSSTLTIHSPRLTVGELDAQRRCHMSQLIIATFDWVPEMPRGYVRDLRVRWALEEAGLQYTIKSVPFKDRNAEHFAHQPFGQVPWLIDGDISIFESGAILLHIAERSPLLLPAEPRARAAVLEWIFEIGRAVQQECRDRSRMPSSA